LVIHVIPKADRFEVARLRYGNGLMNSSLPEVAPVGSPGWGRDRGERHTSLPHITYRAILPMPGCRRAVRPQAVSDEDDFRRAGESDRVDHDLRSPLLAGVGGWLPPADRSRRGGQKIDPEHLHAAATVVLAPAYIARS
jgi:hypothetical protein